MSQETLGEHLDWAQPWFLTKRKDVHTQTSTAALFRRAHYRPAAGEGGRRQCASPWPRPCCCRGLPSTGAAAAVALGRPPPPSHPQPALKAWGHFFRDANPPFL
ncbi:hypothetical protein MC885_021315 [Smutsia gigantea]|nr:hypothetical protein MC885_021315 [Smutsia gigantea]